MSVVYNSGSRLHFGRREGDGGSSAVANAVTSVCNNIFLCALAVTLTLSSRIWGHVSRVPPGYLTSLMLRWTYSSHTSICASSNSEDLLHRL
jgi:hypothetical protein